MPYIPQEKRDEIDLDVQRLPETAGELNYAITELVLAYYNVVPDYASINDVLGALEGAKLEFYRRVAAPYEDTKKEANGDIYR